MSLRIMTVEQEAWDKLDELLEKYRQSYNLSFGMEFSNIIDWHCDITPRRGHPQAREYGLWGATGSTRAEAVNRVVERAVREIVAYELSKGVTSDTE